MTDSERFWCGTALISSFILAGFFFKVARVLAEFDNGVLPVTWVLLGAGATGLFPTVLFSVRRDATAALVSLGYAVWVLPMALALLFA